MEAGLIVNREYPSAPMVGVGAVVFEAACVLLVRRSKAPLAGEWSLPGGAVELGETLEEAVVREVTEEAGLRVAPLQVIKAFDHIERDGDGRVLFHYVLVDFLCSIVGEPFEERPVLLHGSDVSDARWVSVEGLRGSKKFPLTEMALEAIAAGWKSFQAGLAR